MYLSVWNREVGLAIVRNVVGLTGYGGLISVVIGARLAWIVLIPTIVLALMLDQSRLSDTMPYTIIFWPFAHPGIAFSWAMSGLFSLGLIMVVMMGPRQSGRSEN